jgi:hypothetical protein
MRIGDRVQLPGGRTAVVVQITSIPHIYKRDYTGVYDDANAFKVGIPEFGCPIVDRGVDLREVRERYLSSLRKYPGWRAQIEAGIDPTATWGESRGWSDFRPIDWAAEAREEVR